MPIRFVSALAGMLFMLVPVWATGQTQNVTDDYLIGYWGIGSPDECVDSDTLAFYVTGMFAVTNGGGNPVEALGVWKVRGETLTVTFTELDDPRNSETFDATLSNVQPDQFTMTAPAMPDGSEILYRCPGL